MNDEQKRILTIVAQWLEASGNPGNSDQKLVIERAGFLKKDGDINQVQFLLRAEVILAAVNVPTSVIVKPDQPQLVTTDIK